MSVLGETADPNVKRVLYVSTDHLDRPSRDWLDGQEVGVFSSPTLEGWLVLIAPPSLGGLTPALRGVVDQAVRQGCAAAWITEGAPVYPALPTFPEDEDINEGRVAAEAAKLISMVGKKKGNDGE